MQRGPKWRRFGYIIVYLIVMMLCFQVMVNWGSIYHYELMNSSFVDQMTQRSGGVAAVPPGQKEGVYMGNLHFYVPEREVRPMAPDAKPTWYQNPVNEKKLKTILIWSQSSEFDASNLNGCPNYGCEISTNRKIAHLVDAVMFNGMGWDNTVPSVRYSWQRYIFFMLESAGNYQTPVGDTYSKNFFNWTMTYRYDSDIVCPYGYTMKRSGSNDDSNPVPPIVGPEIPDIPPDLEFVKRKKIAVAWFVSNCDASSKRLKYLTELSKYIRVDIYGSCGNMTCARNDAEKCDNMVNRDYFFYASFENTICRGYTTEKYFKWAAGGKIIPLVMSRREAEAVAPEGSFIAIDDFNNAPDFAAHLKKLMGNPQAYLDQLTSWRRHFQVIFLTGTVHNYLERPVGFCKVCEKLWREDGGHQSYDDLNKWWYSDDTCNNKLVNRLVPYKTGLLPANMED